MPERTHDLSELRLPSANLSSRDVAELVGLYVLYREAFEPFFAALLEVEIAAEQLARNWGSHDFGKAEQLISNAVALERQAQPMVNFLPEVPRRLLFEWDYFGPRGCYYLWLKLWRAESDEVVTGAALVFGLLAASLSAVKARVERSEELLLLSYGDADGARRALTGVGLGSIAHVALPEDSYPQPNQTFEKLARSVLGVARKAMMKKGAPPRLTDPDFGSLRQTTEPRSADGQENAGDAGLTLSALLPPDLASKLNTETRRIVRAAGYDFVDKRRSGRSEPLTRPLVTPPSEDDSQPPSGSEDDRHLSDDEFLSAQANRMPCVGSPSDRAQDSLAEVENRSRVTAMDRAASKFRGTTRRVYLLLGEGKTPTEIATALGCAQSNISFHIGKIRAALKPFRPS